MVVKVFLESSRLRTILIVGTAGRLVIAPFFAHAVDMFHWYEIGTGLLHNEIPLSNFFTPYQYSFFLFVFPATILFEFLSQHVWTGFTLMSSLPPALNPGAHWGVTVVPGLVFDFLLKLPLILSDLLIGLFLYRILVKISGDERLARVGAAMWMLNPLAIWISSGWGMFDTFPALFTVLTVYLCLEGRFEFAGASLILSIAMKYYAVVLLFPFLLFVWRTGGTQKVPRVLLVCAGLGAALFLPSAMATTSNFFQLAGTSSSLVATYYPGLSFWTLVFTLFPNFNDTVPSSLILAAGLLAVYACVWRARATGAGMLVLSFALPLALTLVFFRFVGENFFVWLLPFAIILAAGDRNQSLILWGLSFLALFSSFTDSLLPYYMLPMAPWIGGYLADALSVATPYRTSPGGSAVAGIKVGLVYLSAIGVLTSATVLLLIWTWLKKPTNSFASKGRLVAAADSAWTVPNGGDALRCFPESGG